MTNIKYNGYVRISKQRARHLYSIGQDIALVPCKCSIESMFRYDTDIHTDMVEFDELVETYKYYNCNNETGKYPHYYQPCIFKYPRLV